VNLHKAFHDLQSVQQRVVVNLVKRPIFVLFAKLCNVVKHESFCAGILKNHSDARAVLLGKAVANDGGLLGAERGGAK